VWLGRWSPALALPWELLLMEPLLPLLLLLVPLLLVPTIGSRVLKLSNLCLDM